MKGVKILVIEDESSLATALQENLTGQGFAVTVADSGEAGLEIIKKSRPDLLLLDSILPGMNGIEVLKALKPMRDEKHFPIIMLSNLDNPEDLRAAREYDIEEYLVKTDWRLEDIVAKIKKAI